MSRSSRLQGFSKIDERECSVPHCPTCDHTHEELIRNSDFECPNCGTVFDSTIHDVSTRLEYVDCAVCQTGKFLYTISENKNIIECPKCKNILSVKKWGDFFDPVSLLKAASDKRQFFSPKNDIEWLAVRVLAKLAYEDVSSFRPFDADQFEYLLVCDAGLPCGFLSWNAHPELGYPLLNQIWVMDGFRKKGNARSLVRQWSTSCVEGEEQFFVESPSDEGKALFNSLSNDEGTIFGKDWDVYQTENHLV